MNEQYNMFINSFKEHFKQLDMCKTKSKTVLEKTEKLMENYVANLNKIEKDVNKLVDGFKQKVNSISSDDIEQANIDSTLVREQNNFFITSFDCLSTGECDTKKQVKANISKLNLLLEAALKLKFFIEDRAEKVKVKFPDENFKELNDIVKNTIEMADEINISVSKLNARVALNFGLELELNSKLQTFEAVISELKKRFGQLG